MSASAARPDVIVVGAGVIGLVTALHLRQSGMTVEVWTRDDPWLTTSSVAAAIWYPFLAEPRERCQRWGHGTFVRLAELAREPRTGVRMQSVIEVFATESPDVWWADQVTGLEQLRGADVPGGHRSGVRVDVPVCDVPVHMQWLLDTLAQHGVRIVTRAITALDEALAAASVVINCSGLGARELCGDQELQPVRGQVVRLPDAKVEHAWIDDTGEVPCYLIPRADGLIVGGTAQVGDERAEPDPNDTDRILRDVRRAFPSLANSSPDLVRVGLRPYRSTVRLVREDRASGQILIHNYGHGGSGYTLAWGCAEEVARLVTG